MDHKEPEIPWDVSADLAEKLYRLHALIHAQYEPAFNGNQMHVAARTLERAADVLWTRYFLQNGRVQEALDQWVRGYYDYEDRFREANPGEQQEAVELIKAIHAVFKPLYPPPRDWFVRLAP
jgi:hypothetical protein